MCFGNPGSGNGLETLMHIFMADLQTRQALGEQAMALIGEATQMSTEDAGKLSAKI